MKEPEVNNIPDFKTQIKVNRTCRSENTSSLYSYLKESRYVCKNFRISSISWKSKYVQGKRYRADMR